MRTRAECGHLYGPVPSRRLGYSLGIDTVPFKTCSLDCVYCQLGPTPKKTILRKAYTPALEILPQLEKTIVSGVRIDYLTLSGSGEPTLNKEIGKLIRDLKKASDIPVSVLTNGTLLQHVEVRKALMAADLVVPSLDAVTQDVFERINRPHPSLRIEGVIAGIKKFRLQFRGKLWIEVMLVRGLNDTSGHLKSLQAVLDKIDPDRIHLNTVVRPPAETFARPLTNSAMERVKSLIGDRCEIIADFKKTDEDFLIKPSEDKILAILRRRPMTPADLAASLGLHRSVVSKHLHSLLKEGKIRSVRHGDRVYYEPGG